MVNMLGTLGELKHLSKRFKEGKIKFNCGDRSGFQVTVGNGIVHREMGYPGEWL